MEDPDPNALVADVLRRKLPEAAIEPGEHQFAGTALIDLDVAVSKSGRVSSQPQLPWKQMFAALAREVPIPVVIKAARRALRGEVVLSQEAEAALDKERAKLPAAQREGPTKITGTVAIVGCVASSVIMPHWREIRELVQQQRAA